MTCISCGHVVSSHMLMEGGCCEPFCDCERYQPEADWLVAMVRVAVENDRLTGGHAARLALIIKPLLEKD